jgi:hypothetical protein
MVDVMTAFRGNALTVLPDVELNAITLRKESVHPIVHNPMLPLPSQCCSMEREAAGLSRHRCGEVLQLFTLC